MIQRVAIMQSTYKLQLTTNSKKKCNCKFVAEVCETNYSYSLLGLNGNRQDYSFSHWLATFRYASYVSSRRGVVTRLPMNQHLTSN